MVSATGYSGTPLAKKLGITAGMRVAVLDAPDEHAPPDGYEALLDPMPDRVRVTTSLRGSIDLVHLFVTRRTRLEARIDACRRTIFPAGTIWISWPKKSSGMPTDVTEDVIRDVVLSRGLVDVKVCAVDETWSGLKLVVPVAQRE
ncbi:MAG: hypothetical protein JWL76_1904 [Thermoleophilia bacterium]|nr:hypothetical protein [Thermoleophilia bacterium]